MEKRLFLAIALSLLVLLSWSALAPKPQIIENKGVAVKNSTSNSSTQTNPIKTENNLLVSEQPEQELLLLDRQNAKVFFNEQHAAINKLVFKGRREHVLPLKLGFMTDAGDMQFKKEAFGPDSVTFVYQDQVKRIEKKFIFSKNNNTMELQIEMKNISPSPIEITLPLVLARADLSSKNIQSRYQDLFIVNKEKNFHVSAAKAYQGESIKILGFRDQYFCVIVDAKSQKYGAYVNRLDNNESEIGFSASKITLKSGEQIGHSYDIYFGPQDVAMLNKLNLNWSGIVHFGTFDFIGQILLQLLGFFYGLVHNWGWAIIILSLCVYLVLFPLTLKQMRSMKEMQLIQPKIEELRKSLKDNPQKLNKEIMELYKTHKVNPLGGCLPLILQMPIFFALYQALIRSVSLRGAEFYWIKDLSEPDRLNLFGMTVNILPILMAIGMFVQQKISMSKSGGEAAEQQKIMLFVMPIIFGVIFYSMPSGLVLYWFVNSALMLVYQYKIYKQA